MFLILLFCCCPLFSTAAPHHKVHVSSHEDHSSPQEDYTSSQEDSTSSHLVHLGKLRKVHHGVRGDVFAQDHHTLVIHNFHYNGEADDAVFWAGESSDLLYVRDTILLAPNGHSYSFFNNKAPFLDTYRGETVTLKLPDRINVEDLEFLKVWSKFGARDFGILEIPKDVVINSPQDEVDYEEEKEWPKRIFGNGSNDGVEGSGSDDEDDDEDITSMPTVFKERY